MNRGRFASSPRAFRSSQNRVGKNFLGDERAFPDVGENLFLGDDLSRVLGEMEENLHRFRLEVRFTFRADHRVGVRLDEPITEPELDTERHPVHPFDGGSIQTHFRPRFPLSGIVPQI